MNGLFDISAEQYVAGGLLDDPSKFPEVAAQVSPDDFANAKNRAIFKVVAKLYSDGESIDVRRVQHELKQQGHEILVSDLDWLSTPVHGLETYCRTVADKATIRRGMAWCQHLLIRAEDGSDMESLLNDAQRLDVASPQRQRVEALTRPATSSGLAEVCSNSFILEAEREFRSRFL